MMLSIPKCNDEKQQALMNMHFAMEAGDERLQLATETIFKKMQGALNQSEANNHTFAERNAQLTSENSNLKQQLKDVSENDAAHKQAQELSSKAERERVNDIVKNSKTLCQNMTKFAQEKKQADTNRHKAMEGRVSPHSAQIYKKQHDLYISDMDKFEEFAKTIEQLVSKLEQAEKQ